MEERDFIGFVIKEKKMDLECKLMKLKEIFLGFSILEKGKSD